MGCCVSSTQKSYNPKPNQKTPSTPPNVEPEEEIIVVKEVVISELTPKIPELTPKIPEFTPKIPEFTPKIPELLPKYSPPTLMKLPSPTSPESPIHPKQSPQHSAHETAPFRRREKIDEEEEEEEKEVAVVGPPAGDLRKKAFSGEFSGGGGRVRTGEMRESVVVPASGDVGPTQFRRGPGEQKWLRSRSPATGGEGERERRVVGKGMSVRTGTHGCRSFDGSTSTSNISVKSRRVVVERKDTGSGSGSGSGSRSGSGLSCVSESLENPLVSLECFIFL